MSPFPGVKLRVGRRNGPRRNPQNGVERVHRIETAIKTKYKLVEVGLQMMRFDPAVMGAIDPRLQIGEDKMDHRQVLLRLLGVTTERKRVVPVAHFAQAVVPLPTVSADCRSGRYVVLDEGGKRGGAATRLHPFDARDNAEPETPGVCEFLDRDAAFVGVPPLRGAIFGILARPDLDSADYRCLMMDAFSFAARAAAYITFVYLDWMLCPNGIAIGPPHTGTEFVKHCERRLIGGDSKLALKLYGRLAGRLCRHEVGAPKPSRERHVTRLHDRSRSERCILFTGAAAQYDRRARSETVRLPDKSALLTGEAVRPADRLQITGTSAVIWEDALKLG